jgi:hypothetical protein
MEIVRDAPEVEVEPAAPGEKFYIQLTQWGIDKDIIRVVGTRTNETMPMGYIAWLRSERLRMFNKGREAHICKHVSRGGATEYALFVDMAAKGTSTKAEIFSRAKVMAMTMEDA